MFQLSGLSEFKSVK